MRMGQGVRTGLGHGGITCVLQTQFSSCFYAPPQKVAGYYVIPSECLSVRLSVRPSVRQRLNIRVRSITLIPFDIKSRNLVQM